MAEEESKAVTLSPHFSVDRCNSCVKYFLCPEALEGQSFRWAAGRLAGLSFSTAFAVT